MRKSLDVTVHYLVSSYCHCVRMLTILCLSLPMSHSNIGMIISKVSLAHTLPETHASSRPRVRTCGEAVRSGASRQERGRGGGGGVAGQRRRRPNIGFPASYLKQLKSWWIHTCSCPMLLNTMTLAYVKNGMHLQMINKNPKPQAQVQDTDKGSQTTEPIHTHSTRRPQSHSDFAIYVLTFPASW